jgi:hypothetical protein
MSHILILRKKKMQKQKRDKKLYKLFWYANLANLFDVCSTVIGVKIM